jgi:hypothetical protein
MRTTARRSKDWRGAAGFRGASLPPCSKIGRGDRMADGEAGRRCRELVARLETAPPDNRLRNAPSHERLCPLASHEGSVLSGDTVRRGQVQRSAPTRSSGCGRR